MKAEDSELEPTILIMALTLVTEETHGKSQRFCIC